MAGAQQGALNIDGTLTDTSQIDFGSDPGNIGNDHDDVGKSTTSPIFFGLIILCRTFSSKPRKKQVYDSHCQENPRFGRFSSRFSGHFHPSGRIRSKHFSV
jgi:hypothetical protein